MARTQKKLLATFFTDLIFQAIGLNNRDHNLKLLTTIGRYLTIGIHKQIPILNACQLPTCIKSNYL